MCYLVLDEADRMLDDGFEPAIRQVRVRPARRLKIIDMCVYACVCIYMYVCVCMRVCMYVCMYVTVGV